MKLLSPDSHPTLNALRGISIPPRGTMSHFGPAPWIVQLQMESTRHEQLRFHRPTNICGIAVMSECDEKALLVFRTVTGQRLEVPLLYLSQLWPQPWRPEPAIYAENYGCLDLDLYGVAQALVVLSGVQN